MFQSFEVATRPEDGPPRLARLRDVMAAEGLAGFLVPRADAHQGEYVAPCDERLAWLTGFTGSAGFAAILSDVAGVFVDGRYRVQIKAQVASAFTPVDWPETKLGPWLIDHLPQGGEVGFDPWLHTRSEMKGLVRALAGTDVLLRPVTNLVDRVWPDRPAPPSGKAMAHPIELAGKKSGEKREEIAKGLRDAGQRAAVLTLPDSLCWLLNIRGSDIERIPIVQGFAVVRDDARVDLFAAPSKFEDLGPDPDIGIHEVEAFLPALAKLEGPVRVDPNSAPVAVFAALEEAGVEMQEGRDPCILPKACKNAEEISGARAAHLRDAVAMVNFLVWLDDKVPEGGLTEIDVVTALEGYRRDTNALRDISFETISGAGPNGAIVHYRVTEKTNRTITPGELLLVDSGGQYVDGTTDITRTVATGPVTDEQRQCFTRVLQGMIAVSRARFPRGIAGRDLDALARTPLWMAGQDYDHGTGHGVGSFLSVHEGPQRISRLGEEPLQPGMILSNEPGYYREGAFGIRIENLIVVQPAGDLPGGDGRDQLTFETLTWVPIDLRLIDRDMLSRDETRWLNEYHAQVLERLASRVSDTVRTWLEQATRPI